MPTKPQNDQTKGNATQDDPGSEFVSLIVQHRHALYAFIAKQLVHPADAEDVFQKTSLVLWSKMAEFDLGGSFFHWACGIAFNEVRNHRRTQGRNRLHFDSELSELLAEESMAEEELTQARLQALNLAWRNSHRDSSRFFVAVTTAPPRSRKWRARSVAVVMPFTNSSLDFEKSFPIASVARLHQRISRHEC